MFRNRLQAATELANELRAYRGAKNVVVLSIPRGGVVTGAQVAKILELPLDIIVVRKLGHPWNPELAAGAVDADGEVTLNHDIKMSQEDIEIVAEREKQEIKRRLRAYKNGEAREDFAGQTVILVDDGIATGQTVIVATKYIKRHGAKRVIVAAPVAPLETVGELTKVADEVVVLGQPDNFMAVGQFYEDFPQVDDAEIKRLLR